MRRIVVRLSRALPLLALSLAAASCSPLFGDGLDAEREELSAAMRRWSREGVRSYDFTVQRLCFCGDIRPVTVQVREGVPVTHRYADDGQPAPAAAYEHWDTVEELFAILDHALNERDQRVEAEYDSRFGYPVSAELEGQENVADDESVYVVTNFANVLVAVAQ